MKVTRHKPEFVGRRPDEQDQELEIWTWRVTVSTDTGRKYEDYVEVVVPRHREVLLDPAVNAGYDEFSKWLNDDNKRRLQQALRRLEEKAKSFIQPGDKASSDASDEDVNSRASACKGARLSVKAAESSVRYYESVLRTEEWRLEEQLRLGHPEELLRGVRKSIEFYEEVLAELRRQLSFREAEAKRICGEAFYE